jgi:hypothetical protein
MNNPSKAISRKARQERKGKQQFQALAFHPIGLGLYSISI